MDLNMIVIALSEAGLSLKLLCYAGNDKSDIYKMYKQYSKSLVMGMPCDEFYVMNNDADIVFIGSLVRLGNFCNKLNCKVVK
jgi:hypothetical protein